MTKSKVLINLIVFLMLDLSLGTLYGRLKKAPSNPGMVEKSEKAFRCRDMDFHHGLRPNFDGYAYWDRIYRVSTDNYGFKSEPGRRTNIHPLGHRTVFLGDSFTEGIGIEYSKTFVGLFDSAYPHQEVVNMGVASYSPKLYKDKLRHFHSKGFDYDRLILCLDISDIQDEIVYYGMRAMVDPRERGLFRFIEAATRHSLFASVFQRIGRKTDIYNRLVGYQWKYSEERPKWPDNPRIFEEWGRMGLSLAASSMDTIVDMHLSTGKEMVMVIYPWPEQIRSESYNNRHTSFWKNYCRRRGLVLVDLFEVFERESRRMGKEKLLLEYFIPGDVHWNDRGHRFVFRSLDSALGVRNIDL
jgi:hypothetical protein